MAIQNRPDEKIFASKAKDNEVQTFPNLERGWGICFEQTQGIPPMEWFNQLFNRTDKMVQYYLQRGLPEWSESTEYPASAYVQYGGKSYRALRLNTNQRPDVERSEYWVRWALDITDFVALQNSLMPKKLTADSQSVQSMKRYRQPFWRRRASG